MSRVMLQKIRTAGNVFLAAAVFDLAYTIWRIRKEVVRLQKERWKEATKDGSDIGPIRFPATSRHDTPGSYHGHHDSGQSND